MCKEICVLCDKVLEWDDDDFTIKDEDYIYNQCYYCDEYFCNDCYEKDFPVKEDRDTCSRCNSEHIKRDAENARIFAKLNEKRKKKNRGRRYHLKHESDIKKVTELFESKGWTVERISPIYTE